MGTYRSLRDYIEILESHEKLFRIRREVCRETELHPLVRWQFRGLPESERRAFLFENVASVTGHRYGMSVLAGACASSRAVYALGMGCKEDEIFERWLDAQKNPIDPVVVSAGPVQEVEITRGIEDAVDDIPVPLSNPGFDSSLRLTAALWVTADPETGQRNVGIYSGYIRKGGQISVGLGAGKDSRIHLDKCREKGLPLKAAVVIGPTPNLIFAAASTFPYGVDEYAVAGAIAGKPLELLRCRTADLYVPAEAEMILEGEVLPDAMDHNWPFGEFSCYMAGRGKYPRFVVKHIIRRKNPILLDLVAAHPPCEGSKLKQIATEAIFYHGLKESIGISGIKQVAIHEESGGWGLFVIQLKTRQPAHAWQALSSAASLTPGIGKIFIVVDEDIDPHDLDAVMWALVFRVQPHRDIQTITGRRPMMDPSAVSPAQPGWHHYYPEPHGSSALLINAVKKWDYPPVALPGKEYMERARAIWEELELPPLKPKIPWHGYELGHWPDELRQAAAAVVAGR
ncbi:MAG: UbiD family decarboxylase, partial [Deltaproteobacteria bacterium]|nr:UbiD family decarboxylase [Deltaproteobacteria bacterium]